jgi:mono/diheme cytochrome c family protein
MIGVRIFRAVVPLAAALGCQSTGTIAGSGSLPEPAPSRAAELSTAELSHGRMLYANKCAKCHKFYDPAGYDNAEWHMWMRKMSRKAHLSNDEELELSRYLGLYRPARKPTAGG